MDAQPTPKPNNQMKLLPPGAVVTLVVVLADGSQQTYRDVTAARLYEMAQLKHIQDTPLTYEVLDPQPDARDGIKTRCRTVTSPERTCYPSDLTDVEIMRLGFNNRHEFAKAIHPHYENMSFILVKG